MARKNGMQVAVVLHVTSRAALWSLLIAGACSSSSPSLTADGGTSGGADSDAAPAPRGPQFGVLAADPQYAAEDHAAGVRWATIELDWAAIEPARGQYDTSALPIDVIHGYRAAGWKIELSLGLHGDPPAWALAIEPWKDQAGATYMDGPNWFNATIQDEVARYIATVVGAIGPANIDAVRIGGTSQAGEVDYPIPDASYRYTAFSTSALAGTPLIAKNPVPQCKPPTCTAVDAATFFAWYVDSLATFCNFQVDTLRRAGFTGDVQWLFAGGGVTPAFKQLLLANHLAPAADVPNDYGVAEGGIDEAELVARIADKGAHTIVTNTGIDDLSTVGSEDESGSDPEQWSAAHWTAYNADLYQLRKSGENVGYQNNVYDSAANMTLAFQRMQRFGYTKLMWAFDQQLRTEHGATIADYAANIAAAQP